MENSWHSLLCVPGSLIRNEKTKEGGYVLVSSQWGVLLWRATRIGNNNDARWTLVDTAVDRHPWCIANVQDCLSWDAIDVQAVPPSVMLNCSIAGAKKHGHIALKRVGVYAQYIEVQCSQGFPGDYLTVPQEVAQRTCCGGQDTA